MGFVDWIKNKVEELTGDAIKATGKVTADERLEAQGQADPSQPEAEQAGEDVKDGFKG